MLNSFNGVMDQLGDLQLRVDEQRRRQQRLSIIKSSVSQARLQRPIPLSEPLDHYHLVLGTFTAF